MKKIGIVTFHRALNYGAKLQAFALQEAIGERYESYILDYRCSNIESFYYGKTNIKDIIKWILFPRYSLSLKRRKQRFLAFDSFFKLTDSYTPYNVIEANYILDAFIAGSDQIWNPFITGSDLNYFLKFAESGKGLTYAASFGKARLADWDTSIIGVLMKNLINISVREKTSINMIKEINPSLKPYAVLDPVFLLNRNQWTNKLSIKQHTVKKGYIFIYIVAAQTNTIAKAKAIAKEKNWDIVFVDAPRYKDRKITRVNDAGPIEFLDLLFNAELVMTTSFHAFSFSLILNKPFLYELSKEKINANSRLSDLAKSLNVEMFEIVNSDASFCNEYNWERINQKIECMSNQSKISLFDCIERCEGVVWDEFV